MTKSLLPFIKFLIEKHHSQYQIMTCSFSLILISIKSVKGSESSFDMVLASAEVG
jgi:hypothetical protein